MKMTVRMAVMALCGTLWMPLAAKAAPVLDCNGNNAYVLVGTPAALQMTDNSPFTVEGWVWLRSVKSRDCFFSKNSARSGTVYTYLFGCVDSGYIAAYTGSDWIKPVPSVKVPTNGWHHLAYSFDGTTISFLIDGEHVGSSTFSFVNKPAHPINIGGYSNASDIDGHIRDVRMWNYARSVQEMAAALHQPFSGAEPGLLACWPLNEGEDVWAHDITPHASHGELKYNATWSEAALPPGEPLPHTLFVSGDIGLFGTVSPRYGATNGLAHNATLDCSAPAGWNLAGRDDRWRAICTGYTIYTNREAPPLTSGSATDFTYTHNTNTPLALLVWHWENLEFEVRARTTVGGSVSTVNAGWYSPGTSVVFEATALPNPNAVFTGWVGDVPDGQEMSTNLSFVADGPCEVVATFNGSYFVATNGDDEAPGYSWETAKATIQGAVDAAHEGDTIFVSNGVYNTGGAITPGYSLTNRVCVPSAITIRSVSDDPEATVIVGAPATGGGHGSNAVRCVYLATGASLSGFTLTGGFTHTNNGVYQDCTGGGVFLNSGSVVSNCLIATNSAAWYGGGSACYYGGTVEWCEIATNQTDRAGGGAFCYYGGEVNDCMIWGNVARSDGDSRFNGGGGVFCLAEPAVVGSAGGSVTRCLIYGNRVTGTGGGVDYYRASYNPITRIVSCVITGNVAGGSAGGVYAWIGGSVSNCLIAHNRSNNGSTGAGGVYLYAGAVLEHSAIIDNYSRNVGGGVYNRGCTVNNCLVAGNKSWSYGGGIYNDGTVKNSTIAYNGVETVNRGGGVYFYAASARTMQNCIVWGNSSSNITLVGAGPVITHTCSFPQPEGEANFADDPRFVNPARGNYRLASGSRCIDSGLPEAWMTTGADLLGQPRIRGANVDRGCYEYYAQSTILLLR